MSHIETNKSKLSSINKELLMKTLEIVAKKLGGRVSPTVTDYNGRELSHWNGEKIIASLKTPSVQRGVGLIVKNGIVTFVGDDYGVQKAYGELKNEIELTYRKLGLILALNEEGFDTQVTDINSRTLIMGEKDE